MFSSSILALSCLVGGPAVSILILVSTMAAIGVAAPYPVGPDVWPTILTSLLGLNLCLGFLLGIAVACLQRTRQRAMRFGAVPSMLTFAFAVTMLTGTFFCTPTAAGTIDGGQLELCLTWSTFVIYVAAAIAITAFFDILTYDTSRPAGETLP